MELTKETISNIGFELDNHNCALSKWHLSSKGSDWRIMIQEDYLPLSNELSYNVNCWYCNDRGAIIKRASLSDVKTTEDLQTIINLCNIDFKI